MGLNCELEEARGDWKISMLMDRAGVDVVTPLAIITPDEKPDHAIYVRAPRSMLRHLDPERLSDKELSSTMKIVLKDVAAHEGLPQPMTFRKWAEEYLPAKAGKSFGILEGLGLRHTSITPSHNFGLWPEVVDVGETIRDNDPSNEFLRRVKSIALGHVIATVTRANQVFPAGERADLSKVQQTFSQRFQDGKAHAQRLVGPPEAGLSMQDIITRLEASMGREAANNPRP